MSSEPETAVGKATANLISTIEMHTKSIKILTGINAGLLRRIEALEKQNREPTGTPWWMERLDVIFWPLYATLWIVALPFRWVFCTSRIIKRVKEEKAAEPTEPQPDPEWSGTTKGYVDPHLGVNIVRSCPECGGIHPEDRIRVSYGSIKRGGGHLPGCSYAAEASTPRDAEVDRQYEAANDVRLTNDCSSVKGEDAEARETIAAFETRQVRMGEIMKQPDPEQPTDAP